MNTGIHSKRLGAFLRGLLERRFSSYVSFS